MQNVTLLIDGKDQAAHGKATFERRNPITGEVATRASAASVEDANAAADAAASAAAKWGATGPGERRALLLKAAEILQSRTDDFIKAVVAETGASAPWAGFNVFLASNMLREAASLTTQINGEVIPSDVPGCVSLAMRRPAGVVLGIAPWNAPVILGVRAIATPLACGNAVILKASEQCPATHRLIGDVMNAAGFPAGVVNVVTNAPEDAASVVSTLIAHRAVKRVNFTGSTRVGKQIAKLAAEHLKPVLLELGGKAPMIVLDDADIDEAVAAASFGAYMNSGQICMSTERIVVDEKIAAKFVEKFVAKTLTLKSGNPMSEQAPLASVVTPAAAANVQALIDDAVAKGAKLHRAADPKGTLLSASVLDHVTDKMKIYSEESFGPITTIVRVKDEAEAVRVANDTEYGLTSAVFSRDISRALRIAGQLEAGMCHINGATVHDEAQMPFGGTKSSGYGRFGGKAGIAEFTELQWVTISTQHRHYPI